MGPVELAQRARALRLKNAELARLSRVDETTIGHVFNGKSDPLRSTLERIEDALVLAELEQLARLIKIHGCRLVDGGLPAQKAAAA